MCVYVCVSFYVWVSVDACLLYCSFLLEQQFTVGVVSEMIHTASLVHDDVIDEADCRRGKPAINRKWGEKLVSGMD